MVSHSYSFLYACVLYANAQIVGTVWSYVSKMTAGWAGLVAMTPAMVRTAGVAVLGAVSWRYKWRESWLQSDRKEWNRERDPSSEGLLLTQVDDQSIWVVKTFRSSSWMVTVSLLSHLCFQAFGDRISTDHHECPSLTLNAYYQTVREVSSWRPQPSGYLWGFCCCYCLIFIGAQLLYNAVLVSAVQQSESAMCVCVHLFATPVDCSPPGSSVHGIFLARILEWAAISCSRISYMYVYSPPPTFSDSHSI